MNKMNFWLFKQRKELIMATHGMNKYHLKKNIKKNISYKKEKLHN